MIKLDNVSKSFDEGQSFAVKNLSLEVREGETLVLLGTSGSGKTTTLKMINRLIEPTEGLISVDGQNIMNRDPVELRRSMGYVFQGIGLFPHLTVERNICTVLSLLKWPKHQQKERVRELLALVDLDPLAYGKRLPSELSGGQQQRVGVARALAGSPKHLLMDEPFGALDAITRDDLQQQLLDIQKKTDVTIVFVTHDILEALTVAHRIAVMNEGRLDQIETAEKIIRHPQTAFVRDMFAKPTAQLRRFKKLLSS
jgi:osmoprotectant transport system ATP-binding protein